MPDENWRSQLRKGWLELAILATLWNGRLYGLDILRRLENDSDLIVAEGTIYPVLNRLKDDGVVRAEWEESESGHPRKYYSLTPVGRRRTLTMAHESAEFMRQMTGLLGPLLKEERR
jgi:PadR family transcriptional regulator, regulatory protein PadR